MITNNMSTLKIHKLTQEQYERELNAGRIDESAIYLTPYKEVDLSGYATQEQINLLSSEIDKLKASVETWTFTLEDDSTVTKKVYVE